GEKVEVRPRREAVRPGRLEVAAVRGARSGSAGLPGGPALDAEEAAHGDAEREVVRAHQLEDDGAVLGHEAVPVRIVRVPARLVLEERRGVEEGGAVVLVEVAGELAERDVRVGVPAVRIALLDVERDAGVLAPRIGEVRGLKLPK